MGLCFGVYYYSKRSDNDLSYLNNKNELEKLSDAFKTVENNSEPIRSPSSADAPTLAKIDFVDFLDKTNEYHILLSYRILNQIAYNTELEYLDESEKELRNFEHTHNIKYSDEIERIFLNGNFEKHTSEVSFIIGELSYLKPDEIEKLIETKLINTIAKLNSNENTDDSSFRSILPLYMDLINTKDDQEILDRYSFILDQINSPKTKKIFNDTWKAPQVLEKKQSDPEY